MKKIGEIKFDNGAKFKIYLKKKVPKLAKEANDYLYLSIKPEKGRGEEAGWYMNIYDVNNLVWILSGAVLKAHEEGISVFPGEGGNSS